MGKGDFLRLTIDIFRVDWYNRRKRCAIRSGMSAAISRGAFGAIRSEPKL